MRISRDCSGATIGDPIRDEFQTSAAALTEAMRNNQLRNWTRYVVDPKGA